MTGTTLVLGPWGTISAVLAPCFVLNNLFRYLGALAMPPVPPNATVPLLNDQVIAQLQPHSDAIFHRLNQKEPLESVAIDIAPRANVTPGQVVRYVIAIVQQNRPQPPTGGFPVQPLAPMKVLPLAETAD